MNPVLPNNAHDAALWLLEHLESLERYEQGWQGVLPSVFDFQQVDSDLEAFPKLSGMTHADARRIEFFPASVGVFDSMQELLAQPVNCRQVPDRFTVRQIDYTHGSSAPEPMVIARYKETVALGQALKEIADVELLDHTLLFIKSHNERLEMERRFNEQELTDLPDFSSFAKDFVTSELHREQKHSLLRQALLDTFKGAKRVTLGDLLPRFQVLVTSVKSAYAMYMAEFTFEKVKAEVEKDNLDSALKLGKAVSDIQNQLLAMPVALLLVGGQMELADSVSIKNLALLAGAMVFAWLMELLIVNQKGQLRSIAQEIELRQKKIEGQPPEIADVFKNSFNALSQRLASQQTTLRKIHGLVVLGLLFALTLFAWMTLPPLRAMF